MKLKITPSETFQADDEFLKFLLKILRVKCLGNIEYERLILWDEYLNSGIIKVQGNRKLSTKTILVSAFNNLRYKKKDKYYTVEVDPDQVLPYTNIKLASIVDLINDGNMEMRGYPIVTQVFNDTAENLYNYYKIFKGVI